MSKREYSNGATSSFSGISIIASTNRELLLRIIYSLFRHDE